MRKAQQSHTFTVKRKGFLLEINVNKLNCWLLTWPVVRSCPAPRGASPCLDNSQSWVWTVFPINLANSYFCCQKATFCFTNTTYLNAQYFVESQENWGWASGSALGSVLVVKKFFLVSTWTAPAPSSSTEQNSQFTTLLEWTVGNTTGFWFNVCQDLGWPFLAQGHPFPLLFFHLCNLGGWTAHADFYCVSLGIFTEVFVVKPSISSVKFCLFSISGLFTIMVAINLRLLKPEFYSNILIKDFPFTCYTFRDTRKPLSCINPTLKDIPSNWYSVTLLLKFAN